MGNIKKAKFSKPVRLRKGAAALVFNKEGQLELLLSERDDGAATGSQVAATAVFHCLHRDPSIIEDMIKELEGTIENNPE